MYNLFGFAVALFFVSMAIKSLGVEIDFYVDEVAALIVFGGTLSAVIISFPFKYLIKLITVPFEFYKNKRIDYATNIESLVKVSLNPQQKRSVLKQLGKNKKVDSFLAEGVEILLLDLKKSEFKDILTERIYRSRQRDEEWVDLFRRLAKYPPAFGLVGTVLGLISLMRSVGEGANASQIGLNMALALIATLYGLALSNFILAPIAEYFQQKADDHKTFRELLLEGLLMIYDDRSALSVQEMLNSYLEPNQRVDILGINRDEAA